jgi:hypothetical protein
MEIKNVSYYNSVPEILKPKLNYFARDFLNDYFEQIEDIEAGSNFEVEVEYEGDLEVYFVKFIFSKKGGGVFSGNSENELDIYCNYELSATVTME